MDYEKKYNEALKRTRELSKTITGANYEYIFPELKEDEDERIRRVFRGWIYTQPVSFFDGISKEKMLAWLEKQGKNNTGISETTKQKLEDNLNKALEKETSESWNEFLDKQCKQKELNLVEILKHYPRETELYSPLYGKLWLAEVDEENEIITCYKYPLDDGCTRAILEQENTISFYSDGTTGLPDCTISKDCMLFLYNKNQSEQKPVENAEPKFKDGDWIVYKNSIWKVCNIALQNYYELLKTNNEVATRLIKDVDENAHLWTINDAKPGDIIYAESKFNTFDFIAIFSEIKNKNSWEYCSVDSDSDDYSDDLDHWEFDDHKGFVALDRYNFYPATKKQRHLLYQKMKDAGYEWDSAKKEVIRIY